VRARRRKFVTVMRAIQRLFSWCSCGRGARLSGRRVAWLGAVALLVVSVAPPALSPAAAPAGFAVPPLPAGVAGTIPRPAYPRPDLERDHWLTLNGAWAFDLDPDGVGQAGRWYRYDMPGAPHRFAGRIIVPFPWQSLTAFGQGADASPTVVNGPLALYQGTVWYARHFRVPSTFPRGDRVMLNFGAAEQSAWIWINGRFAGAHDGGYLPFALDVTDLAHPAGSDNTLVVQVTQPANLAGYPHGKQGGFWYTRSGGLWQSVWLEAVGRSSISMLHVTPHIAATGSGIDVYATFGGVRFGAARLMLALADPRGRPLLTRTITLAGGARSATLELRVPHPLLWDTTHPWLYGLTATLAPVAVGRTSMTPDVVHAYTGLRVVSVGHITVRGQRYPYVFLNGRPIYLMGALDQDFNPWGVYTAPSDAFLRDDILRAKSLGLNLLRIHIKVPDPRLLYWADRLGMLIWEEPPDFAEDGASYTPAAVDRWLGVLHGMMDRDYNHPATVMWGLMNEEWGVGDLRAAPDRARWLAGVYTEVKRRDPTRLVIDQSGWSHTRTDLFDVHQYLADFGSWRLFLDRLYDQLFQGLSVLCQCISGNHDGFVPPYSYADQPVIMSEYAAGPWTGDWPNTSDAKPDGFRDNAAPFRWLTNDLRLHPYVAGYIYTQYSDVEWEHNGLMRYDRVTRHFGYAPPGLYPAMADTETPRTVDAADYLAISRPPIMSVDPGQSVDLPVVFSHFSTPSSRQGTALLHWRVAGYDGSGTWRAGPISTRVVSIGPDPISSLATVTVRAPGAAFAGDVAFWLEGRAGTRPGVLARNAVALVVTPHVTPGLAVAATARSGRARLTTLTWTFEPGQFVRGSFSNTGPIREASGQAAWGGGSGYLDYRLGVPSYARSLLQRGRLVSLAFAGEAGAQRRTSSLDESAPQTDSQPQASGLMIALDGRPILVRALPDDPSDTRGILSLFNGYHWGEYGYPVVVTLGPGNAALAAVATLLRRNMGGMGEGINDSLALRFSVPPAHAGGLSLYGETVGRIPAPLTLRLTVESP